MVDSNPSKWRGRLGTTLSYVLPWDFSRDEPEPQETPEELEAIARAPVRHALATLALVAFMVAMSIYVSLTVWWDVSDRTGGMIGVGVGLVAGAGAAIGDAIRARGFTHPGGLASRAVHLYRVAAGDPREFKINNPD